MGFPRADSSGKHLLPPMMKDGTSGVFGAVLMFFFSLSRRRDMRAKSDALPTQRRENGTSVRERFPFEAAFRKAHFVGFMMVGWEACRAEEFFETARGARRSNRLR